MSHPHATLSPEGEKVLVSSFGGGLLALLALGFLLTGAPVAIALVPLALVTMLVSAINGDLRHVARHGWHGRPGADGSSGDGGPGGPREPTPSLPSGDVTDLDWTRFLAEYWEYVERSRERELIGA